MAKSETQLFASIKGSPENQFFRNVVSLLQNRLETIKNELVDSDDDNLTKMYKGRARELKYLISGLTRKPVDKQFTGAFN